MASQMSVAILTDNVTSKLMLLRKRDIPAVLKRT